MMQQTGLKWSVIKRCNLPVKLANTIKALYANTSSTITMENKTEYGIHIAVN